MTTTAKSVYCAFQQEHAASEPLNKIIEHVIIYILLALSICGIVGNLIIILTFTGQGLKDSMSSHLLVLSLADFPATFYESSVSVLPHNRAVSTQ